MARKSRKNIVQAEQNNIQTIYKAAAYVRLSYEKEQTIARGTIENQANFSQGYSYSAYATYS